MSPRGPANQHETGEPTRLASVLHAGLTPGILIASSQGRILAGSSEVRQLLGPHAVEGATLPASLAAIAREISNHGRPLAAERAVLGDTTLRVSGFPLRGSGQETQIVLTLQDDSALQRIDENLDRLDRLANIGTLSAGMAHEIKNAFVAVKTFLDLLLERNPGGEFGDVVRRELRRIDAIVSQMLRFRPAGRRAFAPVQVHEVIEHSLRVLQHQFESKLISVDRRLAATDDVVRGDDYQLEQAFVNLFINAMEAMGPNGALTVASENSEIITHGKPARSLRLTVADDGIGIPPENLQRLFEPFFTTKQNGTGLGMAITRRIIREHHGEITARSELNKGTTFEIILPAPAEK